MGDDLSLQAFKAMRVFIPGAGAIPIGDIIDAGAEAIGRSVRNDALPPPVAEPEAEPVAPISADAVNVERLEGQLKDAERRQQLVEIDAAIDTLAARSEKLDAEAEAIEAAIQAGDMEQLAALLGGEPGE
jgi:hypothetical protein